jgi:protein SCO1/2/putative membrane protein
VTRFYRLGVQIVLGTVMISAGVCLATARRVPTAVRSAHDLGPSARSLGSFRLEERSGRTVTADDLADRVAIASFIFTRCPLSCPRISGVMKALQGRMAGTDVLLVSFSVDPEHDTPAVLAEYARRFGALPDRWWFLTGPKATIYALIRDRFLLSLLETPAPDPATGIEAITHSDRLALIDRGRITGLFESNDSETIDTLVAQARRRALPRWVRLLPTVNAGLNASSAALLLTGWVLIRRYRLRSAIFPGPSAPPGRGSAPWDQPLVKAHITIMVLAVAASTLFLTSYLVYHFHAGSVSFPHGGGVRILYLTILLSHTVLATASVPLILVTVFRGWRGDVARHTRIAAVTFPIWLYVAITGVVIYLMLYRMPTADEGSWMALGFSRPIPALGANSAHRPNELRASTDRSPRHFG